MAEPAWLRAPDWQLPAGVHAFLTTRGDGESQGPFGNCNLADHVGDDPARVAANRQALLQALRARSGYSDLCLQWLQQVHGNTVVQADHPCCNTPSPRADALYTSAPGLACAVLTADCLPVLFCSDDGREIAVAHAGWRGMLAGVLEQTVNRFSLAPQRLRAWLGPAIGPCHFEVGPEVREAFVGGAGTMRDEVAAAFAPGQRGPDGVERYFMDLYGLARLRLARLASVEGAPDCTVCHDTHWYSYRAANPTGRFATLIFRTGT